MAMSTTLNTALRQISGSVAVRKLLKQTAPRNIPPGVVAAIMRRLDDLRLESHEDQMTGDVYVRARFFFEDADYCNNAVFRHGALDSGDIQSTVDRVVRTAVCLEPHIWLGLAVAYEDEALERDRHSEHIYDAMRYIHNPQVVVHR